MSDFASYLKDLVESPSTAGLRTNMAVREHGQPHMTTNMAVREHGRPMGQRQGFSGITRMVVPEHGRMGFGQFPKLSSWEGTPDALKPPSELPQTYMMVPEHGKPWNTQPSDFQPGNLNWKW